MSGIAGIVSPGAGISPPDRIDRMVQAQAYRAPDGHRAWRSQRAQFAHLAFHTTAESASETQPWTDGAGDVVVVADARIDYREDIGAQLGLPQTTGDAAIIAAAYKRWGLSCTNHLYGDFAFALWDAQRQRLLVATDMMGMRQVYYHYDRRHGTFTFASTVGAVVAGLRQPPSLSVDFLCSHLSGQWQPWITDTVYESVHRLPPAHRLLLEADDVSQEQYDQLRPLAPHLRPQKREEWIDQFREHLQSALKQQLRSTSPVVISTGGGLDSSALACLSSDLKRHCTDLPPVSLHAAVFNRTNWADERPFFDVLSRACPNTPARTSVHDSSWAFREFGADGAFPLHQPDIHPLRRFQRDFFATCTRDGARVALVGDAANWLLGDPVYYSPGCLKGVGAAELLAEFAHFRTHTGLSTMNLALRALAPDLAKRCWHWGRRHIRPMTATAAAPWLLAAPQDPHDARLPHSFFDPDGLSPAAAAVHRHLRRANDLARMAYIDDLTAFVGIEWRQPYLDRKLVEFCLAMPHQLFCHRGNDRVVLREAMRERMPERIRRRRTYANFYGLIRRGFHIERARIESLLKKPVLSDLGLVHAQRLREGVDAYRSGSEEHVNPLLAALCVESWLQETVRN